MHAQWALKLNVVEMDEHQYILGLGSNIDPVTNLHRTVEMLRQEVTVDNISTIWVTKPVGEAGPDFLNAAVQIKSTLEPNTLKSQVLRPIEAKLGRIRTKQKNSPRTIDIDILFADDQVVDDEVWQYTHKALPLAELKPYLIHPITGETLEILARRLLRSTPLDHRPAILKLNKI